MNTTAQSVNLYHKMPGAHSIKNRKIRIILTFSHLHLINPNFSNENKRKLRYILTFFNVNKIKLR